MSKRKLQSFTIEQKRNICQYNEKYKGIKQKELIIHFRMSLDSHSLDILNSF